VYKDQFASELNVSKKSGFPRTRRGSEEGGDSVAVGGADAVIVGVLVVVGLGVAGVGVWLALAEVGASVWIVVGMSGVGVVTVVVEAAWVNCAIMVCAAAVYAIAGSRVAVGVGADKLQPANTRAINPAKIRLT
jgi:hypothetical protein